MNTNSSEDQFHHSESNASYTNMIFIIELFGSFILPQLIALQWQFHRLDFVSEAIFFHLQ